MWRYPGKPYTIELDDLLIECNPMGRGARKDIYAELTAFSESDDKVAALDLIYDLAVKVIAKIDKVDDVAAFIDMQTPTQIIRLLTTAAQGGSLSEAEAKNSEPSSPAPN